MSQQAVEQDLNATIAEAVKARVEAEVIRALSGDDVFASFISAALNEPVEVRKSDGYRTERIPYITKLLKEAIQQATKGAVQRIIEESMPELETEVRKALRRDLKAIAEALTGKLDQAVHNAYGFHVDVTLNYPRD